MLESDFREWHAPAADTFARALRPLLAHFIEGNGTATRRSTTSGLGYGSQCARSRAQCGLASMTPQAGRGSAAFQNVTQHLLSPSSHLAFSRGARHRLSLGVPCVLRLRVHKCRSIGTASHAIKRQYPVRQPRQCSAREGKAVDLKCKGPRSVRSTWSSP
eukprot:4074799-Prymnesium_polylepis.1